MSFVGLVEGSADTGTVRVWVVTNPGFEGQEVPLAWLYR